MKKKDLIEKLAELEHEQWIFWSKGISKKEKISNETIEKWKKLYVPYEELSDEMKEEDRTFARRVYDVFKNVKQEGTKK